MWPGSFWPRLGPYTVGADLWPNEYPLDSSGPQRKARLTADREDRGLEEFGEVDTLAHRGALDLAPSPIGTFHTRYAHPEEASAPKELDTVVVPHWGVMDKRCPTISGSQR